MKQLPFFTAFLILMVASSVTKASESNTANFLYADPYGHLDQQVVVKVVSVHPEHFESAVRDVVWFKARTVTLSNQDGHSFLKPGGEILVAVDSSSSAGFFHTYGDGHSVRSAGFVPTHSLSGTFRAFDRLLKADPNTRRVDNVQINNGSYFIDLTTSNQFQNIATPTPSPSASPSPSPSASPEAEASPSPSPSPSPEAEASPTPSPSPSTLYRNIKFLINKFGTNQ